MRACACQRTQGQGTHAPFALFTHDLRARVCVCACVRVCMCVCARVCACARTAMFKMCMNNHHGKSFKGFSFREPGLCGDREKWTLILAIDSTGKKAFTLRKVAGTSTEDFAVFVNKILGSSMCPVGGPPRTFLWDNLRSHKSARIVNLVYNAGHRIVCRLPHRPQDGPIECVFNALAQKTFMARTKTIFFWCVKNRLAPNQPPA